MSFRTQILQKTINLLEQVFFYPKLKRFYKNNIDEISPNIIDVGSNKGQSIDFFLNIDKESHIFGFEPNKSLFQGLLNTYKNNSNINILNNGISSEKGNLEFHENILDETSSFQPLDLNSAYLKKKAKILGVTPQNIIVDSYNVKVTTLSDFLKTHENKRFQVLKIDVEGHEFHCLKGLFDYPKSVPIKFIQFEYHMDDMYLEKTNFEKYEALLMKNYFSEVARIKHPFGNFFDVIFHNNMFSDEA